MWSKLKHLRIDCSKVQQGYSKVTARSQQECSKVAVRLQQDYSKNLSKNSYIRGGLPHQGVPCQSPQGIRPKHWGCIPGSAASLCRWHMTDQMSCIYCWSLTSKLIFEKACHQWSQLEASHAVSKQRQQRSLRLRSDTTKAGKQTLKPSLQACKQERQIRIQQG